MKYVSIALDKSGPDHKTCCILKMSAVVDDLQKQDSIEKLPLFEVYMRYVGPITGTIPNLIRYHSAILAIQEGEEGKNNRGKIRLESPSSVASLFHKWLWLNYLGKGKRGSTYSNGVICFNAAGKNFFDSDNQFLKELPSWNSLIDTEFSALDPSLDYLYPDKDGSIPSFRVCLERAGLYDSTKEYDSTERAISWIRLIRKKFPKTKR